MRKTLVLLSAWIAITAAPCFAASSNCPAGFIEKYGINVGAHARADGSPESTPQNGSCGARMKKGLTLPDERCTPGAYNPTVTPEVLRDPAFRTSCLRNQATTAHEKAVTYDWYGVKHPANNKGANQTCELDHLIPLELGGADTLDNIWPECGPPRVTLKKRYFKEKDTVETDLGRRVKSESAQQAAKDLPQFRRGIAEDWTQYYRPGAN